MQEGCSSVIELSARSIEPEGSTTKSTPVAVPSRTASVTLQASSSSLPGVVKAHPPPPPPYPASAHAKLPAGAALPPIGQRAVEAELKKVAHWLVESNPNGQGIVRPKPKGAEQDFRELIPSFLAARGLTRERDWISLVTMKAGLSTISVRHQSGRQVRRSWQTIGMIRPSGQGSGYRLIMADDGMVF